MVIHDGIYYIEKDRWDEFLRVYEKYGFSLNSRFIYPEAITRPALDGWYIRINKSEPCVNMCDDEDKNDQREIWLYNGLGRGWGGKEQVTPYIWDLINDGFVSGQSRRTDVGIPLNIYGLQYFYNTPVYVKPMTLESGNLKADMPRWEIIDRIENHPDDDDAIKSKPSLVVMKSGSIYAFDGINLFYPR